MGNKRIEDTNWEQEFPQVPECVHDAVESACREILQKESKKVRRMSKKGILLLAACLTLFSGMTVLAATSLWQQRMEAMNQEEIEAYFLSIAESGAPAFRYSRPMNAEESDLFGQLTVAYEEGGIFPESCVTILSIDEEYRGKGVGYDIISGTFFLPEELSEEELLQIIDFYHKADYAVQKVAAQVETEATEMPQQEEAVEEIVEAVEVVKEPVVMQDFEALNEAVEYYQFMVPSEEFALKIATGTEYLYIGKKQEILRLPLGEETAESIYTLPENQFLFALDADKENNIYVSIREYLPETDTNINKVVKLNAEGELLTEYDVKDAVLSAERNLDIAMAVKMLAGEDGRLYVKSMWEVGLLLYVFDENGAFLETIVDDNVVMHPSGSMCFGEDGLLYALGQDVIAKVDTESKTVVATYDYVAPEMVAAVDLLYPMDEDTFYMLSYDGIFVTTLGEGTSKQIVAPYESDVFAEGCRRYAVSKDMMVTVNFMQPDLKVTYLRIKE
ncbi:MAG: hypothetical protein IJ324_02130 [Lachnospiraceae bacterium]|nr:hypothetical protein [Lachnospiraceae bacterium]